MEFEDIVYEVVNSSQGKQSGSYLRLIDGISGHFESGTVTGIMGPSGSCKTSFLDFITGRIKHRSRTCGAVRLRGEARDEGRWLSQHCYLEQDDCIVPKQTVYEYILFSVSCRRQDLPAKAILVEIENIMKQLHITHLANVFLSSLSGGERKRVMIAVEFAIGSDVLILDEPTSGLDSHLALELVHMLKTYAAEHNKIVVMTIHQPGAGLFEMIDNLYFFYRGCIIYNGPVSQLDSFLDSHGLLASTSLSRPELLFELFTDYSIIKEVRDCKPQVLKLVEDSKRRDPAKAGNSEMVQGKRRFAYNWSFNARHLALLYKRSLTLTLRGLGFLPIFLVFAVGVFVAWMSLLGGIGMPMLALIKLKVVPREEFSFMRGILSFMTCVKEKFPLALPIWSIVPMLYVAVSVCFMFTLFMNSNILSSMDHIVRESEKGTYSMTTFYFAVLLLEFTFDAAFITLVLIMAASLGFTSALLDPRILLFTYVGILFPKILCLLFGIITSDGVVSIVVGFVKVFLCLTCSLPFIASLCTALKGTNFEIFTLLKYPLMLLASNFWTEYFLNSLYDNELQTLLVAVKKLGKMSEQQESAYAVLSSPSSIFDPARASMYEANLVRAWLTGTAYAGWLNLVLAFGVAIFTAFITIVLYNARYTPSLRLKHSQ